MDEVIRVDFEKQTVSARELHERLGLMIAFIGCANTDFRTEQTFTQK